MPIETLDNITGISVDSKDFFNEYRTLQMLTTGLIKIVNNLDQREVAWEQQNRGKVKCHMYGVDIDGTKGDLDLIACFFHWFGVSICNYARLVGFVRGISEGEFTHADLSDKSKLKHVRSSVDAYIKNVPELTDILIWRNKVGAHFAITAPHPLDNISTLDMSVMFPVTFTNGKYYVGEFTITRTDGSGNQHTSDIPRWSLTEVFESLIPRYWPNIGINVDLK
jgi:hypothetical protein